MVLNYAQASLHVHVSNPTTTLSSNAYVSCRSLKTEISQQEKADHRRKIPHAYKASSSIWDLSNEKQLNSVDRETSDALISFFT